ncbi:MAG: hypothetical protein AAGI13_00760 [Pseudomonadota bacterium]
MRVVPVLAVAILWILPGTAMAQQRVSDGEIQSLDLTAIDRTIREISLSVERLKGVGAAPVPSPAPVTETPPTEVAVLRTDRSESNGPCFRGSDTGHFSPEALDAYFSSVEVVVETVDTTITFLGQLRSVDSQSACPTVAKSLLPDLEQQIGSISRGDLSDLVYHLEVCWPDEGLTEADGSELDMDTRYARARTALRSFRNSQRGFEEVSSWCE